MLLLFLVYQSSRDLNLHRESVVPAVVQSAPAVHVPDRLVLSIGEFHANQHGIQVVMKPPLETFSIGRTWRGMPFTIGAMKALAESDDSEILTRLVRRLGIGPRGMKLLDLHDDPHIEGPTMPEVVAADATALLNWSVDMARKSPYSEEIAADLASMCNMDRNSIEQYIRSFFREEPDAEHALWSRARSPAAFELVSVHGR